MIILHWIVISNRTGLLFVPFGLSFHFSIWRFNLKLWNGHKGNAETFRIRSVCFRFSVWIENRFQNGAKNWRQHIPSMKWHNSQMRTTPYLRECVVGLVFVFLWAFYCNRCYHSDHKWWMLFLECIFFAIESVPTEKANSHCEKSETKAQKMVTDNRKKANASTYEFSIE